MDITNILKINEFWIFEKLEIQLIINYEKKISYSYSDNIRNIF